MGDYCKHRDSDYRDPDWPRGLYRRGVSFRFRRMAGGRRIFQVWGQMPEGDAIRKASRYNMDIEDGRMPVEERARREMTFESFAREVWLKKKAAEVRAKSLARYTAVVNHYVHYLDYVRKTPSAALSSNNYEVASDYVAHRASAPLMPNGQSKFTRAIRHGASKKTIHFEREVLFQLFKEAVRRELISHNPFEDVRPKKPTVHEVAAVHHPLTIEEEAALLNGATRFDHDRTGKNNPLFHDIVLFLVRTGLRDDEMRYLEWTDIDWKDALIEVREKEVHECRIVPIPKPTVALFQKRISGKNPDDTVFKDKKDAKSVVGRLNIRRIPDLLSLRVHEIDLVGLKITMRRSFVWKPKGTNGRVPMCKTVRELLSRLDETKTSNFVFAHHDGGSCRLDVLALLKRAQKMAGIQGRLRIHDLRHTLGFRLRRDKGVALETIMGILRHADIRETLIYAPYSLDEGRAAMVKLDEGPE